MDFLHSVLGTPWTNQKYSLGSALLALLRYKSGDLENPSSSLIWDSTSLRKIRTLNATTTYIFIFYVRPYRTRFNFGLIDFVKCTSPGERMFWYDSDILRQAKMNTSANTPWRCQRMVDLEGEYIHLSTDALTRQRRRRDGKYRSTASGICHQRTHMVLSPWSIDPQLPRSESSESHALICWI